MPARRRTDMLQGQVLGALIAYRQAHDGASPSFEALAREAGVSKSVAHHAINRLNARTPPLVTKIPVRDRRRKFKVVETEAGRRAWENFQQKRSASGAEREEGS